MGVVRMENVEFRYQLVMSSFRDTQEVSLYNVAYDTTSGDILYATDPEPIRVAGESVDEVMNILHRAIEDIRKHGVMTETQMSEAASSSSIEPAESLSDEIIDMLKDGYEEDDLIEMMDQAYDDNDNVIDLVDFMGKDR